MTVAHEHTWLKLHNTWRQTIKMPEFARIQQQCKVIFYCVTSQRSICNHPLPRSIFVCVCRATRTRPATLVLPHRANQRPLRAFVCTALRSKGISDRAEDAVGDMVCCFACRCYTFSGVNTAFVAPNGNDVKNLDSQH